MPVTLWIQSDNRGRLEQVCEIDLEECLEGILTGGFEDPGHLAKVRKKFTLGKRQTWRVKLKGDATQEGLDFVYIKNNRAYREGLMLTPYSETDVIYHLKSRPIEGHAREELVGSDQEEFLERVFRTYAQPLINKFSDKDKHLAVYAIVKPSQIPVSVESER